MTIGKKLILRTAIEITVALLLHAGLVYWFATKQVVATILAAGSHVPPTYLGLAVLFVIVRLFALLLLPGFALQRLVRLAFYFVVERKLVEKG
jgi:hypothetical protein